MLQRDIRSRFGQKSGGGGDEISETTRMSKQMEEGRPSRNIMIKNVVREISRKHGWTNFLG